MQHFVMRHSRSLWKVCFHASLDHANTKKRKTSNWFPHYLIRVKHFSSGEATILQTQGPYATHLKSRGVIRFDGSDTLKFLQGLVTNDMTYFDEAKEVNLPQPTPNQPSQVQPPIYTALLNPQGRFLFDMFIYKPIYPVMKLDRTGRGPGTNGEGLPVLFADVDANSVDDLVHHLKKYQLRAKVEVKVVAKDLLVWQRFGGESKPFQVREGAGGIGWGSSNDATESTAAEGTAEGWRWYRDPRLQKLGLRGLFPSNMTPPLVEANEELTEDSYVLWRLEQGVPEGPTEIPSGEAIPLEYNLSGLNAISFDKGCYVGQELVARTTYRGVIRKRIMPVDFVKDDGAKAEQAVAAGAGIHDKTSGKKVGTVTTVLGFRGLALMRLDAASKRGHDLAVESLEPVHMRVKIPEWWPHEWGL